MTNAIDRSELDMIRILGILALLSLLALPSAAQDYLEGREGCEGERRLVVDVTLLADKWGEAS